MMSDETVAGANLQQAVPFFGVSDMEASLRFYVDGLGFLMKNSWIPDRAEDQPNGKIRWCWLERDGVAIMLQEFSPERRPAEKLGAGSSVAFQCRDSLALYREFRARGVEVRQRPFVGNGLWVVPVVDPDGYRIEFESPTNEAEETELSE